MSKKKILVIGNPGIERFFSSLPEDPEEVGPEDRAILRHEEPLDEERPYRIRVLYPKITIEEQVDDQLPFD